MNKQQEEIREQQQKSWNRFSAGWKKWDAINMDFIRPAGGVIIEALQPAGNQTILDIAGGTGEPGLSIAGMLKGGKVIIADLSTGMLEIAEENAKRRGIRNMETKQCDVCELPFADKHFDAISCRFGYMFFPDMQLAANEMFRVLKSGGRVATAFWGGPEQNFWVTAMMGTIGKNIALPAPLPGAPGMFRCAQPGLMKHIFEQAGFKNITEKEVSVVLNVGTAAVYWNMMTEVGAPIVAALGKADEATVQKIKAEVFDLLQQKYGEKEICMKGQAWVLAADK
ncbi:MAG: class I SAM-dependent methyltransferase [Bacteroidota bacterium]